MPSQCGPHCFCVHKRCLVLRRAGTHAEDCRKASPKAHRPRFARGSPRVSARGPDRSPLRHRGARLVQSRHIVERQRGGLHDGLQHIRQLASRRWSWRVRLRPTKRRRQGRHCPRGASETPAYAESHGQLGSDRQKCPCKPSRLSVVATTACRPHTQERQIDFQCAATAQGAKLGKRTSAANMYVCV